MDFIKAEIMKKKPIQWFLESYQQNKEPVEQIAVISCIKQKNYSNNQT